MEVVGEALLQRAGGRALGGGAHRRAHPHRRALTAAEIPLGGQLAVRLAHQAARDAQLLRQASRRGQRRARRQAPGANRLADTAGELLAQRQLAAAVELHQQLYWSVLGLITGTVL